jgi:hypothetical protein
MKLSKLERIILLNQYIILEKLDPKEAKYYEQNRKAIEEGYTLHYKGLTKRLYDELSEEACQEVRDILNMYKALTFSFKKLEDKSEIDKDKIKFCGFDGNDEVETKMMRYVEYCVNYLKEFKELRDVHEFPDYNSHEPMLDKYRRTLNVWKEYAGKNNLSKEDIIRIIKVD